MVVFVVVCNMDLVVAIIVGSDRMVFVHKVVVVLVAGPLVDLHHHRICTTNGVVLESVWEMSDEMMPMHDY